MKKHVIELNAKSQFVKSEKLSQLLEHAMNVSHFISQMSRSYSKASKMEICYQKELVVLTDS